MNLANVFRKSSEKVPNYSKQLWSILSGSERSWTILDEIATFGTIVLRYAVWSLFISVV